MPEDNDRMTITLEALRSDVERTPLADSIAVRRRGDQRTRRQAVGGALVVAALVAGAVGYLTGGLTGDDQGLPPATGGPTASTSVETPLDLAADPFLKSADFTGLGNYEDLGPVLDSGTEPEVDPQVCAVRPTNWGADQVKGTQFYQEGTELRVHEYVLAFGTSAEAEDAAFTLAPSDLASCVTPKPSEGVLKVRGPSEETLAVPGPEGGTDPNTLRMSRSFTPSVASEPSYHEVAVVRNGNVVVVLEWNASANPNEQDGGWAWTAPVLRTAVDRAVG